MMLASLHIILVSHVSLVRNSHLSMLREPDRLQWSSTQLSLHDDDEDRMCMEFDIAWCRRSSYGMSNDVKQRKKISADHVISEQEGIFDVNWVQHPGHSARFTLSTWKSPPDKIEWENEELKYRGWNGCVFLSFHASSKKLECISGRERRREWLENRYE